MNNSQGRREQRRRRVVQRRRDRMKAGAAVVALGGLVVLGTAGAAAGDEDLRATAGIQLASIALPLFAEDRASEPTPSAVPDSAESDASPAPESTPAAGGGEEEAKQDAAAADAAAADVVAAEEAAQAAAARQAEEAAASAAAEQAQAAERAAAEEAARVAAASVPVDDLAGAKAYASSVLGSHGWDASQMTCLDTLWNKESEWLTSATNASSGAYGIPQALPGIKLATAGGDWQTSYRTQVDWGLTYIESRYGSPCSALNFHYANNWY